MAQAIVQPLALAAADHSDSDSDSGSDAGGVALPGFAFAGRVNMEDHRNLWCSRCVRALVIDGPVKKAGFRLVVEAGCAVARGEGHLSCARCSAGNRGACVRVHPSLREAAADLIMEVQQFVLAADYDNDDATARELRATAERLGKRMVSAPKNLASRLSGYDYCRPATTKEKDTGMGSAEGPMTEGTGRLLLNAVRRIAEVNAIRGNIRLPAWPEELQEDLRLDRDPVEGQGLLGVSVDPAVAAALAPAGDVHMDG